VVVIINPDIVAAQMEGGAIFGLTAAMYGQINLESGRGQAGLISTPTGRFE